MCISPRNLGLDYFAREWHRETACADRTTEFGMPLGLFELGGDRCPPDDGLLATAPEPARIASTGAIGLDYIGPKMESR
jgi:hypothetical protein